METIVNTGKDLGSQSDRVLFIIVILAMSAVLIWTIRYLINDFKECRNLYQSNMMKLAEKQSEMTEKVTTAVTRNSEVINENSGIIRECQTEIMLCRQSKQH